VTIDGVQTELSVVRNIPIFDETIAAGTAGNNTKAITANYNLTVGQNVLNEIGIKLFVTPRLQGESNVFLDLRPEISDQELTPARSSDDDEAKISPIFTRRKLNTQAVVPNGYTLVLGGLASDSKTDVSTKVPFLGDIPGIGLAFRSSTKERSKRNLMIFVTPTRVEYGDYQNRPRPDKFFQTKPELSEGKPEDALSSTKPYDWTKPIDQ
jgi:general secretion pathway protein D